MDKAPVRGLGNQVPQKLKQNVKLAYDFNVFFPQKIQDLMKKSRAWTVFL